MRRVAGLRSIRVPAGADSPAPGLDRAAFHADSKARVRSFLQRALAGAPGPR